jgi:hypothetical protein
VVKYAYNCSFLSIFISIYGVVLSLERKKILPPYVTHKSGDQMEQMSFSLLPLHTVHLEMYLKFSYAYVIGAWGSVVVKALRY